MTGSAAPLPIGGRSHLLVGLFLAAITLRPQIVGLGPLIPDIQSTFEISFATAGLLVTIPIICMGLFAPVAPVLAGRIGAVRAVSLAVGLIAVAGVARAITPGIAGILVLTVLVGAGMGLGNALMVVAVKERFADRPLLVTGVYTTGIQVGSAAAAILAVPIAVHLGGWRVALLTFSVTAVVAFIGWLLLSRDAPRHAVTGVFPRFPLRSGLAWTFVALFGLMGVIFYGITAWIPAAYVELGYSQVTTGWLAGLFNLGTVPTSLLIGLTGARYSRRAGLVAGTAAMIAATLLLAEVPDLALLWIFIAGLANGALFTLAMSLCLDVADHPVDVGAVAGMMLFVGYLVAAAAPTLLGALRDVVGNFDLVLLVFPLCAFLMLLLSLTLSPARLRVGVRGPGRFETGAP